MVDRMYHRWDRARWDWARRLWWVAPLLLLPGAGLPQSASQRIIAAAPATAWREIPANDLLIMTLPHHPRVIIELAPDFAPVHIANIRALAHARYWTHGAIVRVQDNYVVQWSNPAGPALPKTLTAAPPPEYDRKLAGADFHPLGSRDVYAPRAGYLGAWPAGTDGASAWLPHCYGMVGVGRDMPPDTGNGAELYAVIGQAPRHLDRNIALVGRVIAGMSTLSALPRGTAPLGFYAATKQQVPIAQITLAADLPPAARPRFEEMDTGAPAFAAYLDAMANRRDAFFIRPAGAVDLCNAPVPVREIPLREIPGGHTP